MTNLTVESTWAEILEELLKLEAELDRLRLPLPQKGETQNDWITRLNR